MTIDNIIIVSAGKRRSTVVINKIYYQNKTNLHMNDDKQKLQRNPISSIQTKLNFSLKRFETEKKLSRSQYLHLHCNTTSTPRIYSHHKLNKIGHPIRPIVSFCGSPTAEVSTFLSKIFNPLTLSPAKIEKYCRNQELTEFLFV